MNLKEHHTSFAADEVPFDAVIPDHSHLADFTLL